ncbi:type IX secretion system membrane protein PorP/SprF [Sediminibacterium sp. KACHI17]|uniref:Type IX secretion system membrane protein PorP/SprF n=1 Tax=Sediminibacterium sp. KACHI17 TaxID=1751071 RepID=A0AAT9GEQ9_9BACT
MRYLLYTILFFGCIQDGCAQQEVLYTQYMFNALALNPGYAGNKEFNVNMTYRHQWTQLQGAPKTMLFTVEKGIHEKNLGLGFHITKDAIGLQKNISPFLSIAYRIPVSERTVLSSGIAIGFSQYQLDGTGFVASSNADPILQAKLSSTILMDGKFGFYLSNDDFYVGLSAANLFNNNVNYTGDKRNIIVPQKRHFFLMSGVVLPISDKIKLYPSLLIRENFNQPTNADINAFILIDEKIWIGGSYRTSFKLISKNYLQSDLTQRAAASASAQIYPIKGMRLGYSYDFSIGGLNSYFGGTHEISIGYALMPLLTSLRISSPRYF